MKMKQYITVQNVHKLTEKLILTGGKKMTKLSLGEKAPNFLLEDKDDKTYSLDKLQNKFTVVYFYQKDITK